ncbi:hypothetical protein ACIA48_08095 [Mycobacterium sp. NPDC051804]
MPVSNNRSVNLLRCPDGRGDGIFDLDAVRLAADHQIAKVLVL